VEDYPLFRDFVRSALRKQSWLQIIGEVSDGLEAVRKAQELRPDLILLDVGLPNLNGIEAARRIRQLSPESTILFLSENRSRAVAEEGLRSGALGYVVKSDAATDLLPAIESVLQGKWFVSASFAGLAADIHNDRNKIVATIPRQDAEIAHRHKAVFYSDDRFLLDDLTQFVGDSLEAGNVAVVTATKAHRDGLLPRLRVRGLNIDSAIAQGRYIALDAAEAQSAFMRDGMFDSARTLSTFEDLILTTQRAAHREHPRVAFFGEVVDLLCSQGNAEAAIQMEKLGNQLANEYDVDILCGYSLCGYHEEKDDEIYQRICAEHSAVHSR
jgi:DNA-binding NarL/FixJ family response regulator